MGRSNIEPGPFVDKLVAKYLGVKRKKYSTNANSAMTLLSQFINETPCGFSISFQKQLNSQSCKVTLNKWNMDYEASGGYLPMTICLLFINSWAKNLRHYSYEFLKLKYKVYLKATEKREELGYYEDDNFTDEELDALNLHPDIPILFQKLTDIEIKSLVEYANR